ncbi:hypothetical protein [Desulfovibrio oxyclinae]|uniref:hypothetical protein n=1 Tax=Desulfovibrio oxyclinae TaxID=63560 RepID=UPI00037330BF|nr:hypothetical protein [Desulfovibrio oxyclinae]
MSFTPLETLLIGFACSLLSAVGVRLLFAKNFVTHTQCTSEREKMCQADKELRERLKSLDNGQRIQFRMLRGIIVHSNIPAEQQERILNEN